MKTTALQNTASKTKRKTRSLRFTKAEVDEFYNRLFTIASIEYGLNETASRRVAKIFSSALRQNLKD